MEGSRTNAPTSTTTPPSTVRKRTRLVHLTRTIHQARNNYFNPWWHLFYQRGDLHTMQSVTKTVTSVVIGIAIARHQFPSLDTPVLTFFGVGKVANVDDRKRRMTLRHVLTMTTGLEWNEDLPYADPNNALSLMEAAFDWVQFTIDRPMAQEPGGVSVQQRRHAVAVTCV